LAALIKNNIRGNIINLASGKPIKIRKVVEKIIGQGKEEFGKIPFSTGESVTLYVDSSKAERLLVWKPAVTLSQGVLKTVKRYQKK
jgi:nucleoside-diphosphate-sugar epimerase